MGKELSGQWEQQIHCSHDAHEFKLETESQGGQDIVNKRHTD